MALLGEGRCLGRLEQVGEKERIGQATRILEGLGVPPFNATSVVGCTDALVNDPPGPRALGGALTDPLRCPF